MYNLKDYSTFLTSCNNLYFKSYTECNNYFINNNFNNDLTEEWNVDPSCGEWDKYFNNIFDITASKMFSFEEIKLVKQNINKYFLHLANENNALIINFKENFKNFIDININSTDILNNLISKNENIYIHNISLNTSNSNIIIDTLHSHDSKIDIYICKISTKYKRIFVYQMSFLVYELAKCNIKVDNIYLTFIDNSKTGKVGEVFFTSTNWIEFSKAGKNWEKLQSPKIKTKIIDCIKNGYYETICAKKDAKKTDINIYDKYREFIHAYEQNNVIDKTNFIFDSKICNGEIAKCSYYEKCKIRNLEKITPLLKYSGNVFVRKFTIDASYKTILDVDEKCITDAYKYLIYNRHDVQINKNKFFTEIEKYQGGSKLIWFDFETISGPLICLDNTRSFEHTLTQCSIIVTNNTINQTFSKKNLIIDPKKIDINWYKEVIDNLTDVNLDVKYVVYNASFETTVLKSMERIISNFQYTKKIDKIINNILDLKIFFMPKKKDYPIIQNKLLYGKYSIKNVNEYIYQNHRILFDEYSAKQYSVLNISEGNTASSLTKKRFFENSNHHSDLKWQELAKNLQIYCENDVTSMIIIYKYLLLINKTVNS